MRIRESTPQKLDHLFSKSRADSEKALLTPTGGVYSSGSIAGRFLRLLRIARPVELNAFKAHLNSKLSPGLRQPITSPAREGTAHLTAGAFKQLRETAVESHNAAARENFQEALNGLKADTAKLEDMLMRSVAFKEDGEYYDLGKLAEADALVESLDKRIEQVLESRKDVILGKAGKQLGVPAGFGKLVHKADCLKLIVTDIVNEEDKPAAGSSPYLERLDRAGFRFPTDVYIPFPRRAGRSIIQDEAGRAQAEYVKAAAGYQARLALGPAFEGLKALRIEPEKAPELSMKDITRAYRKLSLEVHPDKVAARASATETPAQRKEAVRQATEQFNGIKTAYDSIRELAESKGVAEDEKLSFLKLPASTLSI